MDDIERVVAVPLDWLKPDKVDRRERIATACLAGLLADPNREGTLAMFSADAVGFADALIAELDKTKGEK